MAPSRSSTASSRSTRGGVSSTTPHRRPFSSVAGGAAPPSLIMAAAASAGGVIGTPRQEAPLCHRRPMTTARKFGQTLNNSLPPRAASARKAREDSVGNETRALALKLGAHLRASGYAPRSLSRPSVREFEEMATVLFRQLDPHWRPQRKFEDEFVDVFRSLKYPITISRSSLRAAGSAHTWPTVLQALVWLLDLLRAAGVDKSLSISQDHDLTPSASTLMTTKSIHSSDSVLSRDEMTSGRTTVSTTLQQKRPSPQDDALTEGKSQRAFYDYVGEAYACFLAGDDDKCLELKQRVQTAFDQQYQDARRELENIQAQKNEAQARLEAAQIVVLPEALARQTSAKRRYEHIKRLADDAEASADLAEAQAARQTAALAQAAQRLKELDLTAKSEAETRDLAVKLNQEHSALEADVAHAKTRLSSSQQELQEKCQVAMTLFEQAKPLATEYEARAFALQLVPSTARNADNINLSLESPLNADASLSALIESQDISTAAKAASETTSQVRDTVKPALIDLTEALERRAAEVRDVLLAKRSELDALSLQCEDAQQEEISSQREAAAAKARYDREATLAQRELIDAEREAKSLQADLSQKQKLLDQEQSRLDQETEQHNQLKVKLSQAKANRDNALERAAHKFTTLKTHCLQLADIRLSALAAVEAHCTRQKTEFNQRHQKLMHQLNQLQQDPILLPFTPVVASDDTNLQKTRDLEHTAVFIDDNRDTLSLAALKRDAIDLD